LFLEAIKVLGCQATNQSSQLAVTHGSSLSDSIYLIKRDPMIISRLFLPAMWLTGNLHCRPIMSMSEHITQELS
jgi:hypothetical protein